MAEGLKRARAAALATRRKPAERRFPLEGWLCPKCGRGNSPFTRTCECGPSVRTWDSNTTTIADGARGMERGR